ncbi:MAG: hypothetical protein SFX72_12945 [Isosphaeraceae bacterium]|nr:hypothetical protein [Isosphaeraceae bacterium]
MGHWGVKSYEIDEAADALDAGFERVHGARYVEYMDDSNPLTVDQVQERLADATTLEASLEALREQVDRDEAEWEDVERLAFVGIVVRHAELGVAIPDVHRARALDWLGSESIEWDEATKRRLRREKELALLRR